VLATGTASNDKGRRGGATKNLPMFFSSGAGEQRRWNSQPESWDCRRARLSRTAEPAVRWAFRRCTDDNFWEYRRQRDWTTWKYAMHSAGDETTGPVDRWSRALLLRAPKLSRQPRRDRSSNITATPLPREVAAVFRQGNCDPVHNLRSKKDDSLELMVQIKQRGQIMSALFDILYREYCRARPAEMRKQLLISPERHEVPEAICDANDAVGD
jgi:hypothetical protein